MRTVANSVNMDHLREAVDHLSKRGQLIVALRNDKALTFAEIDHVLSLPAGESKAAYAGILKAIKGYLHARMQPVPEELPGDYPRILRNTAGHWDPEV